jgi:uncharacterized membrane protein YgdD (TMEM256/DUF423 family)
MGVCAAAFGFLAIVAAALGAHLLKGRMDAQQLQWFATANQILMFQSLALLVLALQQLFWQRTRPLILRWVGLAFVGGCLLFCGSLFALALGAPRGLAMLAPIGGTLLMAGWLLWLWAWKRLV